MLDSDSDIKSVIFQKGEYSVIDDVIVTYKNGKQEHCYQVKHEIETSNQKALTFSTIIAKDKNGRSLIDDLAIGWREASLKTGNDIVPSLFTNKTLGKNKTQRFYKGLEYQAITLGDFFVEIKQKLTETGELDKFAFTETESDLLVQWQEFTNAISIPYDFISSFLNKLSIKSSQASLVELEQSLFTGISEIFKCSPETAAKLFSRLVAELRKWTTSIRISEEVTAEIAYEALGTKLEISNEQHRLAPPSPFFKSREEFCRIIVDEIKRTSSPIVFIFGEPGSGKTSIVSHIQATYDLFTIRYHSFRTISPEQRFYNMDMGLCEPRQLWTELMIQIRGRLRGKLREYGVPVVCDHISDVNLRSEVLRLLSIISKETNAGAVPAFRCNARTVQKSIVPKNICIS